MVRKKPNRLTVSPLSEVLTIRSRVGECYLYLTRFTLVTGLAILFGCSTYEKEARLPTLVRAERRLARIEKIKSDPQQKAAEILSIARTAANEIPKTTGAAKSNSEQSIGIYNRAAADLAVELPELTRGRDSLEFLMIQNRRTGEIYRVQIGSAKRGEYSSAYFQELLNAQTLLQLVFVYAPFMNLWFHSAPIAARDWLLPIGIAIFLAVEAEKALLRKLKS